MNLTGAKRLKGLAMEAVGLRTNLVAAQLSWRRSSVATRFVRSADGVGPDRYRAPCGGEIGGGIILRGWF